MPKNEDYQRSSLEKAQKLFSLLEKNVALALLAQSDEASETESVHIIPKEEIVANVMGAVGGAEKEVRMSMLLREEVESPLPEKYHALLKSKLEAGVMIHRLGFGTTEDFEAIVQRLGFNFSIFSFSHIPDVALYQRFILVDNKRLFFFSDGNFCSTESESLIAAIQAYFAEMTERSEL